MKNISPDRVHLSAAEAQALAEETLARIGYDAGAITPATGAPSFAASRVDSAFGTVPDPAATNIAFLQALLAHPLGPKADQIPAVLEDILETHREFLPRFWKK